jgi:universal stress protein A
MRILFATDLSEPPATIKAVESFARQLQAELLVLHVTEPVASAPILPVDPMSGLMGYAPYSIYDPLLEEDLEREEEDAFQQFVAERFSIPVQRASRQGDPADTILRDAREERADLIVMGRRHRSKLQRLLEGSVAGEVVRHAEIPVMLVPILEG